MKTFKEIKALELEYIDINLLEHEINNFSFATCEGSCQRISTGFVNPLDGREDLFVKHNDIVFLCLAIENKVLPTKVVTQLTEKRIQEIQKSRFIGREERSDIKEQVEQELLQKAFTIVKKVNFYIDLKNKYIVINSTKTNDINEITKLLGKFDAKYHLRTSFCPMFLTEWFLDNSQPLNISFADKCKLTKQDAEGKILVSVDGAAYGNDLRSLANNKGIIEELEIIWGNELAFTLTSYLNFKNIRILDFFNNNSSEDVLTNLLLMTGIFAKLLEDSSSWGENEKIS